MKKMVAMLLTGMMLLTCLGGMTSALAADDVIHLRLWGGVQPEYGYASVVENFNEEFKDKGIEIEYVRYVNDGNGNLQLDTYLASGGEIDIFMGYGGTGRLYPRVESGVVLDMTDYLAAADFDPISELGEAAVGQYIKDGKYYALPTKYENSMWWFANVDLFEAAGVPVPYDGWTYSEYLDAVEKLTHGEGQDKTYGMYWSFNKNWDMTCNFLTDTNRPYGVYKDETCNESVFDQQHIIDALNLIKTTTDNGWAPSLADEKADDMSIPTVFLEGKAAISTCISQIRIIKDIETYPHSFKTALIPAPVPDGGDDKLHSDINGAGDLICVSSKTQYPDACMAFVLWYIKGGMAPLARGGRIPLWKGFDAERIVASLTDGAQGVFDTDSIPRYMGIDKTNAKYLSNAPLYAQSEINNARTVSLENVLYGAMDAETALKRLKVEADALIEAAKNK